MVHLETDRLVIRNFIPEDWPALQAIVLDFQASPYADYDFRWPTSDQELRVICQWFSTTDGFLAACLKGEGAPVGYVAINGDNPKQRNLGYCFHSRAHGRGLAAEACGAVLAHAFTQMGAESVVSGTAKANGPSMRLLARLGFRVTGEHTGSFAQAADGTPIEFAGLSFELTKEEFLRTHADRHEAK